MNNDPTPPPIPQAKPLQYAHFEANKNGFFTPARDREILDRARQQAQEWINQNLAIEIVSIDSTVGRLLAVVTVWYR